MGGIFFKALILYFNLCVLSMVILIKITNLNKFEAFMYSVFFTPIGALLYGAYNWHKTKKIKEQLILEKVWMCAHCNSQNDPADTRCTGCGKERIKS